MGTLDNGTIVLFLDVDGVLNRFSEPFYREDGTYIMLERDMVIRLRSVVERYNIRLVFSSSHRYDLDWQRAFARLLEQEGVPWEDMPFIDRTPRSNFFGLDLSRAEEISIWNRRFRPTHFVILDDEPCTVPELEPYWIKCDPLQGFTLEKEEALISILDNYVSPSTA